MNFQIKLVHFLKELPKFHIAIGYIILGAVGGLLLPFAWFIYMAEYANNSAGILIIFLAPAGMISGVILGLVLGIKTKKWWAALFGGIFGGGIIGFGYIFVFTSTRGWYGVLFGSLLGYFLGKNNRIWAALLGGIIGLSLTIAYLYFF